MTISEVVNLTRGDKLRCIPSGLIVKAWERHPEGIEILGSRGGKFTIMVDSLEVVADD